MRNQTIATPSELRKYLLSIFTNPGLKQTWAVICQRFQRSVGDKWDEYAKARAIAKDKKWFRHPGIDVWGPETRDHPFWTHMRRFYVYDPLPTLQTLQTLQTLNVPLLAIFGELDTSEGVKANLRAIRQILDQAGRRDYIVKVYPNALLNARHNLLEVPPDNTDEYARLKRFPPGFFETMVDWTTTQLTGVHQQGVRFLSLHVLQPEGLAETSRGSQRSGDPRIM